MLNKSKSNSNFSIAVAVTILGMFLLLLAMTINQTFWLLWLSLLLTTFGLASAGRALNQSVRGYRQASAGLLFLIIGLGVRITFDDLFALLIMLVLEIYGIYNIWQGYKMINNSDSEEREFFNRELLMVILAIVVLSMVAAKLLISW